jgi:hypothetical protein
MHPSSADQRDECRTFTIVVAVLLSLAAPVTASTGSGTSADRFGE